MNFLLTFLFISCSLLVLAFLNDDKLRLNCNLNDENDVNETLCLERECIWDPIAVEEIPNCYLNPHKVGYHLTGLLISQQNGLFANLKINPQAHKSLPFKPIDELKIKVSFLTENILRFRLTDSAQKRYEVPVQLVFPNTNPKDLKYQVELKEEFNFTISRKENGVKIIDTSIGGLIYSDRFIQFVTKLAPNSDVNGLGENFHEIFRHNFYYSTNPIFTRSNGYFGFKNRDAYGVQPFYTVLESDGKAHGIFLLNSNAMAYTFLPSPALSIKTIGGILDFLVFVGDNPEHVVQLYTSVIGRAVMPPFWGLGFQLCRFGYQNLSHVQKVLKRNLDNNVPVDIQYVDLDYADNWKAFTVDPKRFGDLPAFVNETKKRNHLHWAFNVDPGIEGDLQGYRPFDEGYKKNIFVKWPSWIPLSERGSSGNAPNDTDIMYSRVWGNAPWAFPDFFKNETREWWIENLLNFHAKLNYDAIWLDMNEPTMINDTTYLKCPKGGLSKPLPSQNLVTELSNCSLCMEAVQGETGEYRHYDVHSLYGWGEIIPTSQALHKATGKRGFILSRSTYASSGKYAAHWLGDNLSTWEHLRQSIVGILEFNLFGISFSGVDICGFWGKPTPELCRRWFQLGAYYPFSRNHNENQTVNEQDPAYFTEIGHPEVTRSMVEAYTTRYQLMHYLYTLFYRSNQFGETVARPMHHEFPMDVKARGVQEQFFLGSSILVNPFLYENQTSVKAYVPEGTQWYRMVGDFVEPATIINGTVEFDESFSHRPLLLRAGSILPVVGAKHIPKPLNTHNLRKSPIELWILSNSINSAFGELFYDDGESIGTIEAGLYNLYEFVFKNGELVIEAKHVGYKPGVDSEDLLKICSLNFASLVDSNYTFIQVDIDLLNMTTGQDITIKRN